MKRKSILILVIILITSSYVILTWENNKKFTNLSSKGKNIICFGNSITAGSGVKRKNSYPSLLQERLEANVINAGESGDTTFDALKRLEKDVLNKNPLIVIVEFGGNDYLQHILRKKTLKNLDKVVQKIVQHGSMVILVGIHCGILGNEYKDGLIRIGGKYNIPVIGNVQKGIFTIEYKRDRIHPNKKGYKIISKRIYNRVKKLLILSSNKQLLKK